MIFATSDYSLLLSLDIFFAFLMLFTNYFIYVFSRWVCQTKMGCSRCGYDCARLFDGVRDATRLISTRSSPWLVKISTVCTDWPRSTKSTQLTKATSHSRVMILQVTKRPIVYTNISTQTKDNELNHYTRMTLTLP